MSMPAWDVPMLLGNRLCWFDGENNRVVPVIKTRSLYTDHRCQDLENGFHAVLPTENEAIVEVTYDPDTSFHNAERTVTQWLYVRHPQYGTLIEANVEDGAIVYDPRCSGTDCEDCDCHGVGQWWEYVSSADQILRNLARLGSLPVRVPDRLLRFENLAVVDDDL